MADKNSLKYTNENSLTAPWDKSGEPRPSTMNHPPLNEDEFREAFEELNIKDFIHKFRKVERKYMDPPLSLQNIGLVSFIPTRGARPDSKGVYGFIKLRGNFGTEREADERAEDLIRKHDSYHNIQHVYVGRPFPLTIKKDFIKNINEIDIQKHATAEISAQIKEKREKERKEVEIIQDRAKNLQEEVDKEAVDTQELYTTLRTKKAQLIWTYLETLKKIDQMKESIIKTRQEINEFDEKEPHLREIFYDKFLDARKRAGITNDEEQLKNSFMIYMVDDKGANLEF
jgi:hypothetical protein